MKKKCKNCGAEFSPKNFKNLYCDVCYLESLDLKNIVNKIGENKILYGNLFTRLKTLVLNFGKVRRILCGHISQDNELFKLIKDIARTYNYKPNFSYYSQLNKKKSKLPNPKNFDQFDIRDLNNENYNLNISDKLLSFLSEREIIKISSFKSKFKKLYAYLNSYGGDKSFIEEFTTLHNKIINLQLKITGKQSKNSIFNQYNLIKKQTYKSKVNSEKMKIYLNYLNIYYKNKLDEYSLYVLTNIPKTLQIKVLNDFKSIDNFNNIKNLININQINEQVRLTALRKKNKEFLKPKREQEDYKTFLKKGANLYNDK